MKVYVVMPIEGEEDIARVFKGPISRVKKILKQELAVWFDGSEERPDVYSFFTITATKLE